MTVEIVPLPFEEVNAAISFNKVHFVILNSSFYEKMKVKHGIEVVATMINKSKTGQSASNFGGVIFTDADNEHINSIEDVKGKNFLAVSKDSFGGYHMALMEFKKNNIELPKAANTILFTGTHDKVVLNVINTSYNNRVGTVRTDTLERMADEGKIKLENVKILHKEYHEGFPFLISTSLYPEWPIAKLKQTDAGLAQKVTDALIKMEAHNFAATKASIQGWTNPADYSIVKKLLETLDII